MMVTILLGEQGAIIVVPWYPMDFGNVLLNVLTILVFNNKWL